MLVAEPTFVGGKPIKNVDFWAKNSKMLEILKFENNINKFSIFWVKSA